MALGHVMTTPIPVDLVDGDCAVIARSISKSFGETRALRSVSLSARPGEIHAVVGENGSGKSTLAKVIAAVLPHDSGEFKVFGKTPKSPSAARALGLAMVFQEILTAPGASILDNLYVGSDRFFRARLSEQEKRRRAAELLPRLLGFEIDLRATTESLPLSVRQWLVIARALLSAPRLLLLDEPTAALDRESANRLYDELAHLRSDGVCILVVTHRIAELVAFADRVTVLRDGANAGLLEKSEINEERLLRAMSGEEPIEVAACAEPSSCVTARRLLRVSDVKLAPNCDAINLDLHAGEILGLVGLEGQGQARFLRAISGIWQPHSGEIKAVAGDASEAPIQNAKNAEKAGISYISGDRKQEGVFPNLSIIENFGMPLFRHSRRVGFINYRSIGRMFLDQAARLSIRYSRVKAPISSLSGGNQQKVLIGRSLAMSPSIIALNDPTRGVDISTKHDFYDLLRQLAADGKGVLFLSNEIEEFMGVCDRVAVFRNASVFTVLSGTEVNPDRILAAMFGYSSEAQLGNGGETYHA